jgi:hypothetical protein
MKLFKLTLVATAAAITLLVVGSKGDLGRYIKMKRM